MVQDVHVRVQRELATADSPVSTVGDVAMGLEVTFLNSAVDSVGKLAQHRVDESCQAHTCQNHATRVDSDISASERHCLTLCQVL